MDSNALRLENKGFPTAQNSVKVVVTSIDICKTIMYTLYIRYEMFFNKYREVCHVRAESDYRLQ